MDGGRGRRPGGRRGGGGRGQRGARGRGGSEFNRNTNTETHGGGFHGDSQRRGNHENSNPAAEGGNPTPKWRQRDRFERQTFEEMVEKEPTELLFEVNNKSGIFMRYLNCNAYIPQVIAPALAVIQKALQATSKEVRLQFMGKLLETKFLKVHLLTYISQMIAETRFHVKSQFKGALFNICFTLKALLQAFPSSYVDFLPLTATLQAVCNTLRALDGNIIDDALEVEIKDLAACQDAAPRVREKPARLQETPDNSIEEEHPPDDFRGISIFPTLQDIHMDEIPFLRAIKDKGKYHDVGHYLDIQFRLLREDFLCPLREGIAEYLDMKQKAIGTKRFQHIKVYNNVHIIQPLCTHDGLVYRVQFDVSHMKGVRWQSTKRLLFASLVCLSKDDFQTMLFATVMGRDAEKLQEGFVDLKFEVSSTEISMIAIDEAFIMAETTAYFEAYRHVLQGLKEIDNQLPFQRYIVECVANVAPPAYLLGREEVVYDMKPLLDTSKRRSAMVPVLDIKSDRWPTKEELKLDSSQHKALQTALTKEFALIQGPPGTGKTFIGLQIVKVLLHNEMNKRIERGIGANGCSAILVICYTNHALDQFLEGIQEFCQTGIIRVGGRSKSEGLKQFMLANVKRVMRQNRKVPRDVYANYHEARAAVKSLEDDINEKNAKIEAVLKGVLHEDVLQPFMIPEHYDELKKIDGGWSLLGSGSVMKEWLGLGELVTMEKMSNPSATEGIEEEEFLFMEPEDLEEDVEEDDVDDGDEEAEVIGAQRMLELEDPDPNQRETENKLQEYKEMAESDLIATIDDAFEKADSEWQVQGMSKKKRKQKLKRELQSKDQMTEEEAMAQTKLWRLDVVQRWRLYRYWLTVYKKYLREKQSDSEEDYQRKCNMLQETMDQESLAVMRDATIIGMTTTGAAKYRGILQQLGPKIIIVEEAAEVLESHIITSLSPGCQHLVLIGDHKQLRPTPAVYKLAKQYNLDLSLFERMVKNGVQCETLERQHRMRPSISALIKPIYPELQDDDSVLEYEDVKGVSSNLFFIDHKKHEDNDQELMSKSNQHEAQFIPAFAKYLIQQGYSPSQITILTMYTGQLFLLKKYMKRSGLHGIRVSAVDSFQGEENDIILLSLVRSNAQRKIGFLSIDNRVCVSLSRAKKGFYVIGNLSLMAGVNEMWSKVVSILRSEGTVGPALSLYCQNHPGQSKISAQNAKDFLQAPEGGCMKPCDTRLNCGHVCDRVCHTYDRDHTEYKCSKPCGKIPGGCTMKHKCRKKCYQACGLCQERVPRQLLCGHTQTVSCSQELDDVICQGPCRIQLDCGHMCQEVCGASRHTDKCKAEVKRTLQCGHKVTMACHQDMEQYVCKKSCRVLLDCSHHCAGSCGTCMGGRLHKMCQSKCQRRLVCGHLCKEPCTKDCPPCSMLCENRCSHSKCPNSCGDLCVACLEPCTWSCAHFKCTKMCYEPCDRQRCNKPCKKMLIKCGHPCIGLCGEECPDQCRICHRAKVQEIFFGSEEEEDACFVQLKDCGHVFEVSGLDHWMDMSDRTKSESGIQLKVCPKCSVPIRRNLRYGSIINRMLNDIAEVKKKILGDTGSIDRLKEELKLQVANFVASDYQAYRDFKERLEKGKLHKDSLYVIQNQMQFVGIANKILKSIKGEMQLKRIAHVDGKVIAGELQALRSWALRSRMRFSEQELSEGEKEMERLQMLSDFYVIKQRLDKRDDYSQDRRMALEMVEDAITELTNGTKIPLTKEEKLQQWLKKINKMFPADGLGISQRERIQIVKAMGLPKGHWYKCPNGHVYAIGDCGGATHEAVCPDCRTTIGGKSHKLSAGNAVATEMDGARYGAFTEQANLLNYGFEARF